MGHGVGELSARARRRADGYVDHLVGVLEGRDLDGLRVVVDCANGAASAVAARGPRAPGRRGDAPSPTSPTAPTSTTAAAPPTPSRWRPRSWPRGAHLGLALDGDADRLLAVDHTGALADGDELLALFATDLAGRGQLAGNTVVVTVMTNLGFRLAMAERGITVRETQVGDRYVLEALNADGLTLGGEQSGHIVFRRAGHHRRRRAHRASCWLDLVKRSGAPLAELARRLDAAAPPGAGQRRRVADPPTPWPRRAVQAEVAAVEAELGDRGRVLLRASGTEPLVRVMVEAERRGGGPRRGAGRLCAVVETARVASSAPESSAGGRPPGAPALPPEADDARSLGPMCGIIGATGGDEVLEVLLEGLERLEYRGYDSAGVALQSDGARCGGPGRPPAPARSTTCASWSRRAPSAVSAGIGHTRWATHGHPTEANAHPILDCTGDVAVVHNGIIENYAELADELRARGPHASCPTPTPRSSPTSSRRSSRGGASLADAVRATLARGAGRLRPGRGVAPASPGTIVAGPPGLAADHRHGRRRQGEALLASDIPALLGRTRRFLVLDDDQVVELRPGSMRVTTLQGKEVEPNELHVDWDLEAAEKGGYPDFMGKEIHEQPRAVADTLLGRLLPDGTLALDELRITDDELRQVDKVFVVACGSSYHAGMVAKYAIERWARLPTEIDIASEFRYRDPVLDERTLVVGVSQSGETIDTLQAMREARQWDAKVLVISNVVDSSMAREADGVLYTRAGPEVGRGRHQDPPGPDRRPRAPGPLPGPAAGIADPGRRPRACSRDLAELPELVEQALAPERDAEVAAVAGKFTDTRDFFFLGRHVGFPVALEGALKLKEISYLRAEGYPAGELKHGPIALIEPGTVVVGVATRTQLWEKMMGNVAEVRAAGATVVLVANDGDEETAAPGRRGAVGPETAPAVRAGASTSCPCSCSPTTSPGCTATTSTGPATWPRPSRSSDRARAATSARGGVRGIGVDAVDVARFRRVLERRARHRGPPVHRRRAGLRRARPRPGPRLAARFAAKEAVLKALGVGVGAAGFRDVEVVRADNGDPGLALSGRAAALSVGRGVRPVAPVADPHRHRGRGHRGGRGRHGGRAPTARGDAVKPVLTVAEMRAVDADALAHVVRGDPGRAGRARPWRPGRVRLLGGAYGRHVVVVAGKGNNGADGRVAAGPPAPTRRPGHRGRGRRRARSHRAGRARSTW